MGTTTTAQRFFLFISTGFAVAIIVGLAVWQSGISAKQSASTGEAGMSQEAEASIAIRAAQLEPRNTPEQGQIKPTPLATPNLTEDVFNDPLLPPRAYIAPEHISPTTEASDPSVRTMATPQLSDNSTGSKGGATAHSSAPTVAAEQDASGASQSATHAPQTAVDNSPATDTPSVGIPTHGNTPQPALDFPMSEPQTAPTVNEPTDSETGQQAPAHTGATTGSPGSPSVATGVTN